MSPETCATCRWWKDRWSCVANPPAVIQIPAREFRDDYGPRRDPARQETVWPKTNADDFCGKWEAKP